MFCSRLTGIITSLDTSLLPQHTQPSPSNLVSTAQQ
jgi:hypothetical protein